MSEKGPSVHDARQKSNSRGRIAKVHLTAVFVVALMAASCLVMVNESDESYADLPYCGDNLLYFYDDPVTPTKITITGYGPMWDKAESEWPWHSKRGTIESIEIMDGAGSVTHLGNNAFSNMSKLTSVTFSSNIESIGDHCFSYDSKLESIEIPSSVTTIGNYCFSDASKLASVTLPENLATVGEGVFKDCTALRTITIPESLTSLSDYMFFDSGLTEIVLPSTLTTISGRCFILCDSLTSITIPDSVTDIKIEAFLGCPLSYIHFGTGLTNIHPEAFTVNFYEYGGTVPMSPSATNLKGKTFVIIDNRLTSISNNLVIEGNEYSVAADASSVEIVASDLAYVRQNAEADSSTTFKVGLNNGIIASFDSSAIKSLIIVVSTVSVTSVDKGSLDEKTRELVGDDPVYEITFGNNTNFGAGKMTVTVPYALPEGKSSGDLKVFCIKDGEVSEKIDCTYADGKITFSTGHLSTYSIGFDSSSGSGGKFPVWAIIIIIIVVLAAAGGAAAFFVMKKKGSNPPSDGGAHVPPKAEEKPVPAKEDPAPAPVAEEAEPEPEPPVTEEVPAPQSEPEQKPAEPVAEEAPAPVKEEPAPAAEEAPAQPEAEKSEAPAEGDVTYVSFSADDSSSVTTEKSQDQ